MSVLFYIALCTFLPFYIWDVKDFNLTSSQKRFVLF